MRLRDDAYETPTNVTEVVAPYLHKSRCRVVWDPCDGPNSLIAKTLRGAGFKVVATNADFLMTSVLPVPGIDSICTSPPYGLGGRTAHAFIRHALKLVPTVFMLLRVDYDSGKTRTDIFANNLDFVGKVVLLDRIRFFQGPSSPSDNHCWFVWRRGNRSNLKLLHYARLKGGTP
jgi:hypothetical protein